GTDFDAMELAKLAMQRYDNDSSILITCTWESLEGVMGEPAADRFAIVTLDGPSYRWGALWTGGARWALTGWWERRSPWTARWGCPPQGWASAAAPATRSVGI